MLVLGLATMEIRFFMGVFVLFCFVLGDLSLSRSICALILFFLLIHRLVYMEVRFDFWTTIILHLV